MLVHWTSWKQWQIRLCLHQPLHNACEVNLGNLGSHVHCFQCKMWPLIAVFRDIFSPSVAVSVSRSLRLACTPNRFGSVAQLFAESTYFDPVPMFIILGTMHATKVAFIKRLEKCILFLYIYYWCYRQMATATELVILSSASTKELTQIKPWAMFPRSICQLTQFSIAFVFIEFQLEICIQNDLQRHCIWIIKQKIPGSEIKRLNGSFNKEHSQNFNDANTEAGAKNGTSK